MKKHWFTADPHAFHGNIMKYCRRTAWMTPEEVKLLDEKGGSRDWKVSYESVRAMTDALIANINHYVEPGDTRPVGHAAGRTGVGVPDHRGSGDRAVRADGLRTGRRRPLGRGGAPRAGTVRQRAGPARRARRGE